MVSLMVVRSLPSMRGRATEKRRIVSRDRNQNNYCSVVQITMSVPRVMANEDNKEEKALKIESLQIECPGEEARVLI
jgi:hypothetical protein